MTTLTRCMALALTIAAAAWAAPAASADSLAYIKDGNIKIAASDLSGAVNLTSDGGWTLVTQGDDGTIVGMKDDTLHRVGRDGRVLNEVSGHPLTRPSHIQLSPNGRVVAVSGIYRCSTSSTGTRLCSRTFYLDSAGSGSVEQSHEGDEASWIGDGRVALWGGAQAYTDLVPDGAEGTLWFSDTDFVNLNAGEVTRAGDKLVVARGNDGGEFLRFYSLSAPPPAEPSARCERGAAGDRFSDPTWSPDGTRLAWVQADGVHVGEAPNLADCSRNPSESVIGGATSPDWGAAGVPTGTTGGGGGAFSSSHSHAPRLRLGAVLRRGVPVTVECSATCGFNVTLKLGRKKLGSKTTSIPGGGKKKAVVKLTRAGKRLLSRRLPARVKVVVTVSDGSESYAGSSRLTVKR